MLIIKWVSVLLFVHYNLTSILKQKVSRRNGFKSVEAPHLDFANLLSHYACFPPFLCWILYQKVFAFIFVAWTLGAAFRILQIFVKVWFFVFEPIQIIWTVYFLVIGQLLNSINAWTYFRQTFTQAIAETFFLVFIVKF